jgi:hypothetical protein
MSMMARTESRAANWTSAAEIAAPLACAFAVIFSPIVFSTWAQLPSSAETSSPLAGTGQFGRFQDAPRALFATACLSSFNAEKKACHSPSTEPGFS